LLGLRPDLEPVIASMEEESDLREDPGATEKLFKITNSFDELVGEKVDSGKSQK
jgi:hypothetical protein